MRNELLMCAKCVSKYWRAVLSCKCCVVVSDADDVVGLIVVSVFSGGVPDLQDSVCSTFDLFTSERLDPELPLFSDQQTQRIGFHQTGPKRPQRRREQ